MGVGLVGEFDAGGGRLVQQANHVATGGSKRLYREEALVAVGIGGNSQHHLQMFLGQQRAQRGRHFAQHLDERHRLVGELQHGIGAGVFEQALERAQDGPAGVLLACPGLPAINALLAFHGDQRREPVDARAVGMFEGEDRVIAAIHRRHHGASGAEINS